MKIPIVDENDNFLYLKDRNERDNRKEITRSASVFIFNEKGEFLLAKRSMLKKNSPNKWAPSAEGLVEEGETYESNVIKEAKEELGVNLNNLVLGPKRRESDSHHEYFIQCFFATISSNTSFILQEEEVGEVKWVSVTELKDWYTKKPEEFLSTFVRSLKIIEEYENKN